jgi:Putative MetA-pathway of phenol degradation
VNLVTCHWSLITLLHSLLVSISAADPLAKGIQDNSFFVEEAYNQEPGVVQHILNVPVFFTDGGKEITLSFTQEWPIFSQTHQFSYTIPHTFTEDENGLEDIRLNYRLQALMESKWSPAFAPRFSLVTPTGDADKDFGQGRLGYEVNLPFSKIVSNRWSVHFNAGGSVFPDVNDRDLVNYNLGGSAIYAVSRNLNLMLESVALWEEDVDLAGKVDRTLTALLSPGARYAFNFPNDAQLVVGLAVPVGLVSDSPDYGFFFYCSFEHPFMRTDLPERND